MSAVFKKRLQHFQQLLPEDAVALVTQAGDLRYFTDLQANHNDREAFLFVSPSIALLLHSPLIALSDAVKSWEADGSMTVLPFTKGVWEQVADHLQSVSKPIKTHLTQLHQPIQLLIDAEDLRVAEQTLLQTKLKLNVEHIRPLDRQLIWQQRLIKDATELQALRRAAEIATTAVERLRTELAPGVSERAAARRLDNLMIELGADQPAFPTIIAFGPHTALPHHQPTTVNLTTNIPVLIDCGASFDGYCSDLTRTFWFGSKASDQFLTIETVVKNAYQAAVDVLNRRTDSTTGAMIDDAVRSSLTAAGYGHNFIHSTGHGLGLDIHEPPALTPGNETELKPGMAITIEPGIYLQDKLGYRHENTMLLTENGTDTLT